MIHQAKAHHKCKGNTPIYHFGVRIPRNAKQALELDKENGNTLWQDAMNKEIANLNKYNTFKDMGNVQYLPGHKRIIVHFVFAVKHDLRHKACLVAGGHLTEPMIDGSYLNVVSL